MDRTAELTGVIHDALLAAADAIVRELSAQDIPDTVLVRATMMAFSGVTSTVWMASSDASGVGKVETMALLQTVIAGQCRRLMEPAA